MDGERSMSRDRDLETVLEAWLADGPEVAPAAIVEVAIEAAGRRPRRPWNGWAAGARAVSDRLRPGEPARRLAWIAAVAAALLLALWVAIVLGSRPAPLPRPLSMNGLLAASIGGQLVIADPNGGRVDPLEVAGLERSDLVWTSDGRYLAVRTYDLADDTYRIDLLTPEGSLERTLFGPVAWIAPGLDRSPDGTVLAVAAGTPGEERVVLVPIDDGEPRTIEAAMGTQPVFDPGGDRIAFIGRGGSGSSGVLVVAPEPDARPRLVEAVADPADASRPAWSSDGRWIVVRMRPIDPAQGGPALFRVPVEGGDPEAVGPSDGGSVDRPVVLGDDRIVVDGADGLVVVDPLVAGSSPLALAGTVRPAGPGSLTSSPDGRRVAVLVAGDCDGTACRPTRLATIDADRAGATWSSVGSLPQATSDPVGWSLAWQPLPIPDGPLEAFDIQRCATQGGGTTTGPPDRERYTGVVVTCSTQASDPRLSGTFTLTITIQMAPDDSATLVGTSELANADGSWVGDFTGTVAAGYTDHDVRASLVGTGAFAGLRAEYHIVGTATDARGTVVIEPVSSPSP